MSYRTARHLETPRDELSIMDIDDTISGSSIARFNPLGYYLTVYISPFVLLKLFRWAINQGYIYSESPIIIHTHNRIERIQANG